MRCPFCGAWFENSMHKAFSTIPSIFPLSITNIDYVLEVGNKITVLIEEKHTHKHLVKTHQIITLKRIAKAVGASAIAVFVDDCVDDVAVYEIPLDVRFPSRRLYSFEQDDPIFIGGFKQFGRWILKNYVYPNLWR